MDPRVLIAAAAPPIRTNLASLLSGFPVISTDVGGAAVFDQLQRHATLRLLILVESLEDGRGTLDLVEALKSRRPDVAVLLINECGADRVAEAIGRGAEDVLPLPCPAERLRKQVERILEAADLRDRVRVLRQMVPRRHRPPSIIGHSAPIRRVLERAYAAARNDTPVLITGETGTGKELVARAIHANSRRAQMPFVPVNCAALPRDLLESELFGHKRGAFSGAHADYAGLFVAAHSGTLFLDEIGELPAEAQPKLLRVLQDGEVRPVGGLDSRKVDVRVIAATNQTLDAIRQGVLRQDLFFRLSVVVIDLPPLRARLDDVPLLVRAFLAHLRERGFAVDSMDDDAIALLSEYAFPGNVRELENLIEGVAVMLPAGRTTIGALDVRGWLGNRALTAAPVSEAAVPLRLERLEAWAVAEALRRTHGNKRQAALLLGISRDTLYRKLQEIAQSGRRQDSSDLIELVSAAAPRRGHR